MIEGHFAKVSDIAHGLLVSTSFFHFWKSPTINNINQGAPNVKLP